MLPHGLFTVALLASLGVGVVSGQDALEEFRVAYEWFSLDFTWADANAKWNALKNGTFVPANCALAGVKYYRDRLYLTVPRWRTGIPATLVSVPAFPTNGSSASPKLEPFPDWAMQEVGNCTALQFVQNVEIDPKGRMWTLDTGRVDIMGANVAKCPPKLVIFDLDRNGTARVIRTHVFAAGVAVAGSSYLADLVLDASDGWYAYISDGGDVDPGLIVYSFERDRSWKVRDKASMSADPATRAFTVGGPNGSRAEIQQNVYPIAFDVDQGLVYYSALSSWQLFSIPAAVLKREFAKDLQIREVGKKLGVSASYVVDDRGVFYYGRLDDDSICKWDTKTMLTKTQEPISRDHSLLQWPSGFGFDMSGYLWLVSNRMHNYIAGHVNLEEPNYRIIRGLTGTKSYLFSKAPAERMRPQDLPSVGNSTYEAHVNGTDRPLSSSSDVKKSGASWLTQSPLLVLLAALYSSL